MRLHDDYDYDAADIAWNGRRECDGNGCIPRRDGLHHDKINGPHYWCTECPGCSRCESS